MLYDKPGLYSSSRYQRKKWVGVWKDLSWKILAVSLNIQACFCLHFIQASDNSCSSEWGFIDLPRDCECGEKRKPPENRKTVGILNGEWHSHDVDKK